jgi:hypothetical protein
VNLARAVCLLLLGSAILAAVAAAEATPISRQAKWRAFPDPKPPVTGSNSARELFPDWQPEALASANYAELLDRQGRLHACITSVSSELVYAVVIHFSPAGSSRLVVNGIALYQGQAVTLTFLPAANDSGALTQLSVWRKPPADKALSQLMLTGTAGDAPLAGLCYLQWFKRTAATRQNPPWQDIFLPRPAAPSGFVREDWPLCLAEIAHNQDLLTKDCAVQFKGLTSFGLDQDGPYGFWQLSWNTPLTLKLDIAGQNIPNKSTLLVYAQVETAYPWGSDPALEVTANGYRLPQALLPGKQLILTQPISVELSQYLQQGTNTVDIGSSAFGAAMWQVRRVELWAE